MKFFAVFSAVLAVACAGNTWTLQELSSALENPTTDAVLKPGLMHALNVYMDNIFAGQEMNAASLVSSASSIGTYTLAELDQTITSESTSPVLKPYFEEALNELMAAVFSGQNVNSIEVHVPALQYSYMSLAELDSAIHHASEDTKPYLENALDALMQAMWNGQNVNSIVVALPIQSTEVAVIPSPAVAPTPAVVPTPSPVVAPTPVSSSPLVQIILNVNRPDVVDVAAPVKPVSTPSQPSIAVQPAVPVNPIDALAPMPIENIPVAPVNPIDSLAPLPIENIPVAPVNPIDALAPLPIENIAVNPIDIMAPVPTITNVVAVGPIV